MGAADDETNEATWRTPLRHTQLRFFKTIKGFHKGRLDLKGRHAQRYKPVVNVFEKILDDISGLLAHIKPLECTEDLDEERLYKSCRFDSEGEALWSAFQRTWRLPDDWSFELLMGHVFEIRDVVKKHPTPIYQKVCLADLPAELLYQVFEHAELKRAKVLSSTCRQLRQIGSHYIFAERTLELKAKIPWGKLPEHGDERSEYLLRKARRGRKRFLADVMFLLSRPDLLRSIRTLFLANHWDPSALLLPDFSITEHEPCFFEPVLTGVAHVMRSAVSASATITNLRIRSFVLTQDILDAISQMDALNLVTMLSCTVPERVQNLILTRFIAQSHAVINVHLMLDHDAQDEYTMWYLLPLFPSMRTLTICGHYEGQFEAPIELVREACNPFASLERLSLEHFTHYQVGALAEWMVRTTTTEGGPTTLKLTHLMVHTRWSMPSQDVQQLISALRRAPDLRVLALDGLDDAPPALLRDIAQAVPSLHGLTLIRRENMRQHQTKPATWPAPSWEYAQNLGRSPRLRFFGWNASYDMLDSTPAALVQFERNAFDDDEWASRREQPAYFMDDHLLAAPFAAYCATLEAFAVLDRTTHVACRVKHSAEGYPVLEPVDDCNVWRFADEWYPGAMMRWGWPVVQRGQPEAHVEHDE